LFIAIFIFHLKIFNVRMVSSESIISAVYSEPSENGDVVHFSNPMEVQFYPRPEGNTMLSLSPWMPFGDKDIMHEVYTDTIITMSKVNQEMVDYYNKVVIKYTNGFASEEPEREDTHATVDELEESLDVIEALTRKAKGTLH